ncbi:MAG: response regulator [Syntrophaceae bacterium]|nr:response regulator [Syntrophaceae bacterium]
MKDQSLQILMVNDLQDDVFPLIHQITKGGYSLIHDRVNDFNSMKKALQKKQWDIVICNHKMDKFNVSSAIDLLKESKADIPLIIVSGTADEEAAEEFMRLGARDYITKNNLSRLCPVIERELDAAEIREKCKWMEKELEQTIDNFQYVFSITMQLIVSAIEAREPYKKGHQLRSANLACAIAEEIGLNQEIIQGLRVVSSIYDIGNLTIPAEILAKPSKLTDIEYSLVKEHPQSGYEILKNVETSWPLAQIVQQHHERMDGSGYPQNLKGDDILMEARILAVSDVVESMASARPHRLALGIDTALEEIKKKRGILYDSAVADACLNLFYEKGYQFS